MTAALGTLIRQAAAELDDDAAAPVTFTPVPLADLAHTEPAPVVFAWAGRIPTGAPTLLGGHGGSLKTSLALQLGICTAVGRPMLGIDTRQAPVIFYSAEDGAAQMRRGVHRICRALQIDPASLEGSLHIIDATTGDPALYHEVIAQGRRFGAATPALEALRAYAKQHCAGLVIVDNASDTLDANENDRARVRGFMRAVSSIAEPGACAVLLLAHVDKGTSRGERSGTESYSGSTAWHNSARSRLYLSRDRDGMLTLEHQKHNLGPLAEPLRMEWTGGALQLEASASPIVRRIDEANDSRSLLKALHRYHARGEWVATDVRSRYHAARVLATDPDYPRRRKPPEVFALLRDAEAAGHIEREAYRDRYRHEAERWRLTPKGLAFIGAGSAVSAQVPALSELAQAAHTARASAQVRC